MTTRIESMQGETADTEALLKQSKNAFFKISTLNLEIRNRALETFARLTEETGAFLLAENAKDLEASHGKIKNTLYKRLELDSGKLAQVIKGIRDVAALPDPIGQVLERTTLDTGLELEKVSVPLGVIAMVFESRPDVIPQILSLALKSGNAVVLKGGREALKSNHAFMTIVAKLEEQIPELPSGWAQLVDTREDFQELLSYPEWVDLVIPRGSNELVRQIMNTTQIPVLGHAEGICHIYVHDKADLNTAVSVAIDAKAQYPAVCNALETLLVDAKIAEGFLPEFERAASEAKVQLKACARTRQMLPQAEAATEEDWTTEYGDLTLSIKVVDGLDEAVFHINRFGSHHTDGIISEDAAVRETFLQKVDSATVVANASTRFADGFRFGLGAEVGTSTLKIHARGPVGLEGLTIYKYVLRGEGQVVAEYVGENAKPFLHQKHGGG
jgi:glutamate-5-semialdehyde dehydrogenase